MPIPNIPRSPHSPSPLCAYPGNPPIQPLTVSSDESGRALAAFGGHGTSQHDETGDYTNWKDIRVEVVMDWTGDLTITGSGVSVLRRDCLGATQCMEALITAETARRAVEARRFPGSCFRINSGDAPQLPRHSYPVISPPAQPYPGLRPDEVCVPFVLLGHASLKTGRVVIEKTHIHLVDNSITYEGHMEAIELSPWGGESTLPMSALAEALESSQQGRTPNAPVHAVRFYLEALWSHAWIAIIPRRMHARAVTASPQRQQEGGGVAADHSPSQASHAPRETDAVMSSISDTSRRSTASGDLAMLTQCVHSPQQQQHTQPRPPSNSPQAHKPATAVDQHAQRPRQMAQRAQSSPAAQ